MCEKEAYTRIELVSPVNETSPVISILEDYDNRPYHFCYAVNSIAMFLKDLEKNNIVYNIIKSPQEAILFNMQKVMFILVDAVGLIELRENVNLTYEQIDDIVLKNRVTIVTNDITKAKRFYSYLGYQVIGSGNDCQNKTCINSIWMNKEGFIQTEIKECIPDKEFTQRDYIECLYYAVDSIDDFMELLKKNKIGYKIKSIQDTEYSSKTCISTNKFDLYYEFNSTHQDVQSTSDWTVYCTNESCFKHKAYLLPLQYHKANRIVMLPYQYSQSDDEKSNENQSIEDHIRLIWQSVLHKSVNDEDNIFAIGGNSLDIASIIAKVYKKYHITISMEDIFRDPTCKAMIQQVKNSEANHVEEFTSTNIPGPYGTTQNQKNLFVFNEYLADNVVYNMPRVMLVRGVLDINKLKESFVKLTKRHESLRSSFELIDGQIMQVVHDNIEVNFKIEKGNKEDIDLLIHNFIRPFDLKKAPLVRLNLTILSKEESLLMLDIHHIISDGISMGILFKELMQLYNGEKLQIQEYQFKDYYVWQDSPSQKLSRKQQKKYWQNIYTGEIPVLNMPLDYPRPKKQVFEGDRETAKISKELLNRLKQLANKTDTTLFNVLFAAYNILLSKYTMQDDIIVGCPVTGRRYVQQENIVGMFINILPLRNRPIAELRFSEFLDNVKENFIRALENQEYSVYELMESLQIKRDLSRNPLFDTMFVLQNMGDKDWVTINVAQDRMFSNDIYLEPIDFKTYTSKYDFSLEMIECHDEMFINLEYCTKIFSSEKIKELLNHYIYILGQILDNYNILLKDIKFVTNQELSYINKLVNSFNKVERNFATLDGWFEDIVCRFEDRQAIVIGEQYITYKKLNEQANRIAWTLIEQGVEHDAIVGILVHTSIEMIAAMLGIMKAGAAYLPIDVASPKNRLKNIVQDSGIEFLLVKERKDIPEFKGRMIDITKLDELNGRIDNPYKQHGGDNLAYVIYTSGSTGIPKGVMIEHHSVVNYIAWRSKTLHATKKDVTLQLLSYAFDGFVSNLYFSLLNGGLLVLIQDEERKDFVQIREHIKNYKVTNMSIVPSLYRGILEDITTEVLQSLRFVCLAGEKTETDLIKMSQKLNGQIILVNEYGPTENTVCTTANIGMSVDNMNVIGKPIDNQIIYIMDMYGNPVPIGVPGELYVAGNGLARGYVNNKDLTNNKFVTCENNMIFYKTGDLVKLDRTGLIEFIGRIDQQIKIRGYRIELGEIQSALLDYEGIQDAAAVVKKKDNVAYISAYFTSNTTIDVSRVKENLADRLPDYMLPRYLKQIEKIPVTQNGKIDNNLLISIADEQEIAKDYIRPRDEVENQLVAICKQILNINNISMNDNFFDLGGDSLKASLLISKILNVCKIKLTLNQIFDTPIIYKIADAIKKATLTSVPTTQAIKDNKMYQASPVQKRFYVLNKIENIGTSYNMPLVFEIEGYIRKEKIEYVLNEIIKRHEILRTSFMMKEGELIQYIHDSFTLQIEYEENDKVTSAKVFKDFIKVFDLEQLPLIRGKLIKRSEAKYIFILDMHHIISDGIAIKILVDEFIALYEGRSLSNLKYQYKDYVYWENILSHSEELVHQKEYWLNVFHREFNYLNLPIDYIRPSKMDYKGDVVTFLLNQDVTSKIKSLCLETGSTTYMFLLACFNILLAKCCNQSDIIIGSPLAGRNHPETENMVGNFINTVALRNNVDGEYSFSEFLKQVKGCYLDAYENQDYQFENIVSALEVPRSLNHNPLFDVLFTFNNIPPIDINISKLKINLCEMFNAMAKYDLTLTATEVGNGIKCNFQYKTSLFKKQTIHRLVVYLKNIILEVLENPLKIIKDITMLSQEEYNHILYGFNETEVIYSKEETVVSLFKKQVLERPNQVAIVDEATQLTYLELDKKSTYVTKQLKNMGVKTNTIVAVMTGTSNYMIIGILGILKSGGAYLPIDPNLPKERIQYLLKESRVKILVCEESYIGYLNLMNIKVLKITDEVYDEKVADIDVHLPVSSLAYVIYTSGTTGTPKGVAIKHSNLINYINWFTRRVGINVQDKTVLLSSYAFDLGYTVLYSALLSGCQLHLVRKEKYSSPSEILNYIAEHQITYVKMTPSLFNAVVGSNSFLKGQLEWALRLIILGGETPNINSLKVFHKKYDTVKFMNHYGPTETTIGCITSMIDFDQIDSFESQSIIGKPINNTKVYILDQYRKPVPTGTIGDIYIAGEGVGAGYINQDSSSNSPFIDNPFVMEESRKMYKTGDLGKFLDNGNVVFIGRNDKQLKIRGYRVDTHEIEKCLLEHKAIDKAVVLERCNQQGSKYLCAYIVYLQSIGTHELRKFLMERLPEYMIPSYFIEVRSIPLTLNGKIDKVALNHITIENNVQDDALITNNEREKKLIKIWREILGIQCFGINDNFFEVGGNSLLLIQLHSKLEASFNCEINMSHLFIYTTISQLSVYIDGLIKKKEKSFKINTISIDTAYFIQGYQQVASTFNYKIPEQIQLNLNVVASKNNICIESILIGLYAYILSDELGETMISIQTVIGFQISQVEVNLNQVDDLIHLFKSIYRQIRENDRNCYCFDDIDSSKEIKNRYEIIPLICKKEFLEHIDKIDKILNIYDIIVAFDLKEDGIELEWYYNSCRLRKHLVEELYEKYVYLLEYITNN